MTHIAVVETPEMIRDNMGQLSPSGNTMRTREVQCRAYLPSNRTGDVSNDPDIIQQETDLTLWVRRGEVKNGEHFTVQSVRGDELYGRHQVEATIRRGLHRDELRCTEYKGRDA